MPNPAVPTYVSDALQKHRENAPGHTFSLYFPGFTMNWEVDANQKKEALKAVKMGDAKALSEQLVTRQIETLGSLPDDDVDLLVALSESPFATGLGNEHPVENGFSFLTPYGIPYLSGSGVKGVLRRAAETVALFSDEYTISDILNGFSLADVWLLFGFEGESCAIFPSSKSETQERNQGWVEAFARHIRLLQQSPNLRYFMEKVGRSLGECAEPETFLAELLRKGSSLRKTVHTRGAISFWDVFPDCKDLVVEIMTPHYSGYYQDKKTPHDSGQPTPIPFLAVPAGTKFTFPFQCDRICLPEGYDWKGKMRALFEFACKWEGFGAKTAIGYGALVIDPAGDRKLQEEKRKIREAKVKERREAEEKALVKAMTEEGKIMFAFRKLLEKAKETKYQPNGKFDEERRKFLTEAQKWTNPSDRTEAVRLLEESFKWGMQGKQYKEFGIFKKACEQV